MTRKQKRLGVIAGGLAVLGAAAGLVLYALSDTIVFFYVPSEIAEKHIGPGQRFRLGGLVRQGSLLKTESATVTFDVTDNKSAVMKVAFTGQLPDLFREGQGVVAEGAIDGAGVFQADTVLAKHDENYMPKEVADKLKEQGVWQGSAAP
jgi:cytochrome c-type biogenesis protein CcmE